MVWDKYVYTVDPWTTQVWTMQVHLHVESFSINTHYSTTPPAVDGIHGYVSVDMEGQLQGCMWIFDCRGSAPLTSVLLKGQLYMCIFSTRCDLLEGRNNFKLRTKETIFNEWLSTFYLSRSWSKIRIMPQCMIRLKNHSLQSKCQWILPIFGVPVAWKVQHAVFTWGCLPWQLSQQKHPIFAAQCLWVCSLPPCLRLGAKALGFYIWHGEGCRRPRESLSSLPITEDF